jgi:hypothetical protein
MNHAKVKAFCEQHVVTLTTRTPNSFFYCSFDVIEYAWTKLTGIGLIHLFSTKLWYSIDEVDHFMIHINAWSALLTPAQLATTSCDGFWSLLGTDDGHAVAMEWYRRLTAAQFTTTSCDGFWSLLGTACGNAETSAAALAGVRQLIHESGGVVHVSFYFYFFNNLRAGHISRPCYPSPRRPATFKPLCGSTPQHRIPGTPLEFGLKTLYHI